MAISYRPFGGGSGTGVSEAEWTKIATVFGGSGIIRDVTNEWEVFADSTGMQIKIKTGEAMIKGHHAENDAEITQAITSSDPTNPRIDVVVLRVSWVANTISLVVIDGTPGATPVPEAITQTASIWDLPIAHIAVAAAASTIAAGDVTDKRVFANPQSSLSTYSGGELTIATGAITVDPINNSYYGDGRYSVDTEGDAASDILTTINGGNNGDVILLQLENVARRVVIADSGNIVTPDGNDIVLEKTSHTAILWYDLVLAKWIIIGGSWATMVTIQLEPFSYRDSATVEVGDGQASFVVPTWMDGYNLYEVHQTVQTAGTTGTQDVQVRNETQAADMLTTKSTIDSTETSSRTALTPSVINAANDDVVAGDVLDVDVDTVQTTPAAGLIVELTFVG